MSLEGSRGRSMVGSDRSQPVTSGDLGEHDVLAIAQPSYAPVDIEGRA
jgi:hypothetical protein